MSKHDKGRYGWPRLMLRRTACEYLNMGEIAFEREIFCGNLPEPLIFAGRKRWDRHQIDEHINRLTGGGDWRDHQPGLTDGSSWRDKSPLYHPELRAEKTLSVLSRRRRPKPES
jgi:hypothetical protein